MLNYYSLHNLVTLKTNLNLNIPNYFKIDEIQNPDIEYFIGEFHPEDYTKNYKNKSRTRNFFYWTEDNRLYIDYNFPFINAKATIQDLERKPKIQVTKSFLKYSRIGIPIRPIIQLKLIQKGYSLIHAGCLNYDGESILVVAPRDSGKTSTILSLLSTGDFKFMSDDLTIVFRNRYAFSYPEQVDISPHTITKYIVPSYNSKIGKSQILTSLFGRIFNIELTQKREIPSFFLDDKGKISKVFILTGGKSGEGIKKIDEDEAVKKIFIATTDLINPMKEYLLNLYSYACDFPIFDLVVKQYSIIESAIYNAECFEVCSNNIEKYSKIIKRVIK